MHELTLYSRPGCHLCDEMLAELRALVPSAEIGIVNIDADERLTRRYGRMIPVLSIDGDVICFGRLDRERLLDAMAL